MMKNMYTGVNDGSNAGWRAISLSFIFKLFLTASVILAFNATIKAQPLSVIQNANSQTLAQLLTGSGVTISNYTLSCAANGSGTFTNNSSNLGVPGGVVLSSGRVTSIANSAIAFGSSPFTLSGDVQLSGLTAGTIYDPCVLEFDVVPQGPLLRFNYVFASEEYPEFVCSPYNDVFGFFISGPNPGGGNFTNVNMATIPGNSMPVAINTVNGGTEGTYSGITWPPSNCPSLTNTAYYRDNRAPTVNPHIVYDGMTTVLQASSPVIPCQTYHLKIAIADVADRIYDSGVFLDAYSFTSPAITITATAQLNISGYSSAYEGCVGGTFTLTVSQAQSVDMTIPIVISGTATNGTDYATMPTSVVIPAGQTSVTIPLTALADGVTELPETVSIAITDPCTGGISSSATLTIQDDIPSGITVSDTTLCASQSAQLNASGGLTYTWTPTTGLSNPNISNPIATPATTTTYTVNMVWGSCIKTRSATVRVSNPVLSTTSIPGASVCNGGTVDITTTITGGVAPFSYLWNTGAITPTITVATGGVYSVTSTDAYGCTSTVSQSVIIANLAMSGTTTNVSCMGGSNGAIDITVTGTNAPFTYNWNGGITSQDRTNLFAGTYTVTVSNTVGCSVTASYTITQPASNLTTSATNTSVSCNGGNNGTISLTVNGGVGPYTYIWSNSATTEDLSGLAAGSYSVTVTDFNGCTAARTVNVTQTSTISTSETHINTLCFGGSTGSIDLTVSGGATPYSYAWSDGSNTQDINSLDAGSYTVSVADANSCVTTRTVVITQPTAVTVTPTGTNPSCFGTATGSVNITVSGGTPGYTYVWSNGPTTQNISSLAIGTYRVTVSDNNLCSATATTTLTQPALLTASTTRVNVTCNGGGNGSINLTAAGGTSPYTYLWNGGATTEDRTGLTAGVYTVTVTDNRGCTATASATLTQPSALSLTNTTTTVSCNGGSNGSINITVSGSVSPYTYNWGGGVTTEDRTGLAAGTYNVTATDTRGCTITSAISITQPAVLTFSETHTNITCSGGNSGTINVTLSGGTSPYTYNWGGGINTQNRTGLAIGTYTVTGTDNRGCTVSGSTTIVQPGPINISEIVTDATCAPGNNGDITLTVTGGTSPYTFNWGGGITTQNRTALFAGTYTVTVTDNIGCTALKSISVTQIGIGMTLSATTTNTSCFGGSDGTIDLTVTGGNPPINYDWGGGITTEDRTGLAIGNYSVTVTDGLGCSAISNSNISEPTAVTIDVTKIDVRCFGESTGSITTSVSGGTPGYTYDWGGGITTPNRTAVPAGSYTVIVADANACSVTAVAIIVGQPSTAVNLSAVSTNVSCFGADNGFITLTVTGGSPAYTFDWSNGSISQNLSNVVSGTYSVTVVDANTCSATLTSIVTQPTPAVSVVLVPTDLSCNNDNTGAITTTVTGGTPAYNFVWDDATITQNRSALTAGNYSVTVTDINGCSSTVTTAVTEPNVISIASTPINISCNGGSNGAITLNVAGGTGAYSFNWAGGVTTQNRISLIAGTYTVTVTDANTCSASATETITQPTALTLTVNSSSSVCASATGTATAVTGNTGTAPYAYVWSNGGNTRTLTGLAPGSLSVSVTDANGCSISGSVVVGLSGNNTDASFSVAGNYCAPNAAVNFTHTGSSNITTHIWDFGDGSGTSSFNSPSYTFPTPGTFTVTHTVVRGFCADTITSPLTIHQKPILSSVTTNVSCFGMSNGAIDLTVTGSPAFTYSWTNGSTSEDVNSLATGSYTVTVTDVNSCSSSLTASITEPTILAITNVNTNVSCFGGSDGDINLTVVGGIPGYTYDWGGGITTQNRTGLSGGTYTVTVTDANACTSSRNISVYQPNAVSIAVAVTNVSCNGLNNGSITLTVTGGTGGYTYDWGGGITTQNRNGLANGTYSVTVTDAKSCSASASATTTQPGSVTATLTPFNVACFGGNSGSIQSFTTGGIAPYSYTWNDGNTQVNRSALSAGTYSVTIVDQNTCSVSASATLTQPSSAVNVVVNSTTPVPCYGNNTGTINITASGGVPGYAYLWSDNSNLEDRTNMLGGTYFVTASDQQGCISTVSATINEPSAPLNIDTIVAVDVLCFGAASGSLTTTVSGGTTPYSFDWGGGVTTQNLVSVVAGTYNVIVTDANACSASASAVISQPAVALSASATATNVACFGGSTGDITLSISGGITPYTFDWGGGVTTQNRTSLSAGTYNVVVTDSNSCTTSASATVTQPVAAITASATLTNVSCFGGANGTILVTVNGGTPAYTFDWGGVTIQNRTNLAAGTYTVTITDAAACIATTSATVTEPAALNIAMNNTNVSCNGASDGIVNITVTGGTPAYTFLWNNGATAEDLNNLVAGNYSVVVRDANNCVANANATITQPTGITLSETHTAVSCNGGSNGIINITVNGGVAPYTYLWNDGATTQNRTNLNVGTYSVTVSDATFCAITQPIVITQPASALSATITSTNILCNGASTGAIVSAVSGGTPSYTYAWSNGTSNPNISNVLAGNYSLTVTDANACSVVTTAVITQPTALNVNSIKTDVACNGASTGSVNLSVAGGTPSYTYLWTLGAVTQDVLNVAAGNYSVTVSDANSCSVSQQFTVTQPAALQLSTAGQNPSCYNSTNGSVDLTVSGGVAPMNYVWSNGTTTEDPSGLAAGYYFVLVTDNNGCTTTGSATLVMPTDIHLSENHRNPSCNGVSDGIVNLAVSGGTPAYQFAWSNTAITQNLFNVYTGAFSVTVTDANGCSAVLGGITITEPSVISITVGTTNVACAGENMGSADATVNGGTTPYNYNWSNNAHTQDISNVAAGAYTLTVTDANSCTQTASAQINTMPQLDVDGRADQLPCENATGGIDLTVNSGTIPYTFLWSNGATTEDLNSVNPGVYSVIVHDGNGCPFDTSFTITNQNTFNVNASGGGTITLGQTIDLHATSTGSSLTAYSWTPTFGMNCPACADVTVQPGQSTTYTVVAVDTNGCVSQDVVSVDVIDDFTVWTPNAFTPNGDGNNDFFQLYGNHAGIRDFSVMIFNRWGEKVYDSEETTFKWDGIYKGEPVPPAVYVYVMKIVFLDAKTNKTLKGSITIMR